MWYDVITASEKRKGVFKMMETIMTNDNIATIPYGDGTGRIFLTGDTHGSYDINKLSSKNWPEGKMLTRNDYLIVLGDFGLIFDKDGESPAEAYWLDWLESKPWTTLWIDGNHENFNRIYDLPVDEWHGGNVHYVRPNIIHLMRGEIYDICGLSFLAFGGAESIDKYLRYPNEDWWEQELPSEQERANCVSNLIAHGDAVDVVLTHDGPAGAYYGVLLNLGYTPDKHAYWMDANIRQACSFKRWYFGHIHTDAPDAKPLTPLYNSVVELDLTDEEADLPPRFIIDEDGNQVPAGDYVEVWKELA